MKVLKETECKHSKFEYLKIYSNRMKKLRCKGCRTVFLWVKGRDTLLRYKKVMEPMLNDHQILVGQLNQKISEQKKSQD